MLLGNEKNASGGGASAHVLLLQVVPAVLEPVSALFTPVPPEAQEGDHLRRSAVSKTCDELKLSKPALRRKKSTVINFFMFKGLSYGTIIIPMKSLMYIICVKVWWLIMTGDYGMFNCAGRCVWVCSSISIPKKSCPHPNTGFLKEHQLFVLKGEHNVALKLPSILVAPGRDQQLMWSQFPCFAVYSSVLPLLHKGKASMGAFMLWKMGTWNVLWLLNDLALFTNESETARYLFRAYSFAIKTVDIAFLGLLSVLSSVAIFNFYV